MQRIESHCRHPLYGVHAIRLIEQAAQSALPPHTLMRRAGLAIAQLALALAPHAQRIWIACGPGNNGGDGLEAAMHLHRWGKHPIVTWLGDPDKAPPDTVQSYQQALAAGIRIASSAPDTFDFCIDALLGIGSDQRPPEGRMGDWIARMNASEAPVLAVDLPTGLASDTGMAAKICVRARHTLSLLCLKPGLFTADGRDHTGVVWMDDLGVDHKQTNQLPQAWLAKAPAPTWRAHASHKGSYGDVAIIGGATGMTGAALLAASSALHGGAGRVFVGLLDGGSMAVDLHHPELMFRPVDTLDLTAGTTVIGCGAGSNFAKILTKTLITSVSLVIDADALNLIAKDQALQSLLRARAEQHFSTVLTPHPLEAGRLLGCSTREVQRDRLQAARQLALSFNCVIVLKGSGTVIATPSDAPTINPTGNGRLATAGTGDVLAGMIGACMASEVPAAQSAIDMVYRHGLMADQWPATTALVAGHVAQGCKVII